MRTIQESLLEALANSWTVETSSTPNEWSSENPARGQCVPSSLVIQDYLGGEIRRYRVSCNGSVEMHYNNELPDGNFVDSTREQYPDNALFEIAPVDLKNFTSVREKRLADPDTVRRYGILSRAVASIITK